MEPYTQYFEFQALLGQGAFGKVYKVRPRNGFTTHALKIIEFANYQITSSDVMNEFTIMKRLRHPNILPIFEVYSKTNALGNQYLSSAILMEYCPNGDLSRFIRERRGSLLPLHHLLHWMKELSSAVAYIHGNNILHRDLKPDNILLDQNLSLKISDFGIAKLMTQSYATTALGTPHFVAPEVLGNNRYTDKADIYSLGKVFICMGTMETVPSTTLRLRGRYQESVVNVIACCVQSEPSARPSAAVLLRSVAN